MEAYASSYCRAHDHHQEKSVSCGTSEATRIQLEEGLQQNRGKETKK